MFLSMKYFKPYSDQWEFLSSIRKLSEDKIKTLITRLTITVKGNELGTLRNDDEENSNHGRKFRQFL